MDAHRQRPLDHKSSILSTLGVRDRTRAVLKALERGDI
jgi:DNA-binding NarL/FixJ family response regulator